MDGNEATRIEKQGMDVFMPPDDRTLEVQIEGKTVYLPALTLERTLYYFNLYDRTRMGDAHAQRTILKEFPEEVGLLEYKITPAEVFDIVRVFCFRRSWNPVIPAEKRKETGAERTPSLI